MKVCREKLLRMYITYSRETKTQYLHTQNNCYRLPNATLLLYEFLQKTRRNCRRLRCSCRYERIAWRFVDLRMCCIE